VSPSDTTSVCDNHAHALPQWLQLGDFPFSRSHSCLPVAHSYHSVVMRPSHGSLSSAEHVHLAAIASRLLRSQQRSLGQARCNVVTAIFVAWVVSQPASAALCGRAGNGTVCSAAQCCSAAGECGVTETHCSVAAGCQSNCWVCGDGRCTGASQVAGETCGTCPDDCGPCTSSLTAATSSVIRTTCSDASAVALALDGFSSKCVAER
jgi:hypothetical protein